MGWFRKHEQAAIFDRIEKQLRSQPTNETRNRKRLRPNQVAEWELRVGKYRVFYEVDVAANAVEIELVGYKEGNKLFVRDKEYRL